MIEVGFFVVGLACLTWGAFWLKKRFYHFLLRRKREGRMLLDPDALGFLNKLISLVIVSVAIVGVLHFLGINILPLVTFGGIGAGLMAFSGKDVLINFFSGLMLQLSRPFSVGEQVELPGKEVSGHIEEIGWCSTAIRDRKKRMTYLPNSVFTSEVLVNVSRTTGWKFDELIRLRRLFSLEEKVEEMRHMLTHHPRVDGSKPIYTFVKSLTHLFVEIEIQASIVASNEEEFMEVKQELLLAIYRSAEPAFV